MAPAAPVKIGWSVMRLPNGYLLIIGSLEVHDSLRVNHAIQYRNQVAALVQLMDFHMLGIAFRHLIALIVTKIKDRHNSSMGVSPSKM